MKKYRLQSVNCNGDILYDNEIEINEGDTIILLYNAIVPIEKMRLTHEAVKEGIENNSMISLPHYVDIKILRQVDN